MPWGKPQMRKWLALRGWQVTGEWPSGRVWIVTPRGKVTQCGSLEKAFKAIREWMDARAARFAKGSASGTRRALRAEGGGK